ncbi:hypothetical protein BDV18DRAFT_134492 [Aspergillus unguis]
MFEDFSFSSPSSSRPPRLDDDKLMTDCDALISPMSSRCPSPRSFAAPRFPRSRSLYFRSPQQQQPPTSVPFSAYDHHRLSIGTLTKKLHEHTIQTTDGNSERSCPTSPTSSTPPRSSPRLPVNFPGYVLTPPDTDTDHDDEGYASPISPLTPQSPSLISTPTSAPLDHPIDIRRQSPDLLDLPPTSGGAGTSAGTDPFTIRSTRQNLSRIQGQYASSDIDNVRRALLAAADEEMQLRQYSPVLTESCHPSSLPPSQGRRRKTIGSQRSRVRSPVSPDPPIPNSGSGIGSGDVQMRRKSVGALGTATGARIEKNKNKSLHHGPDRKKSEAGLRRKSMVSAALASMIENE